MKLLWLCNSAPGVVRTHITGKPVGAVNWVDHVLSGVREQGLTVRILCPGDGAKGKLDEGCSYATFREGEPYRYLPELEETFRKEIRDFQPDVIHSWGLEYGHTLAMVNAAEKEKVLAHMVASIQGLCGFIAGHYAEGVPYGVQRRFTFRDLVRQDNIRQQQKKFALRGQLEQEAMKKLNHIIGRTGWDRACTELVNPGATYHFCNETLREEFYEGQWDYEQCRKHRIFASSCAYPVKGFHYLLEAFSLVLQRWPDATLAVTGKDLLSTAPGEMLRRGSYQWFLAEKIRQYHLEDKVAFLGSLRAEEMKQAYLDANVFVLPSTVENSPNSLGEAMLLGVPCVASDVGGVPDLMVRNREGLIYTSTAPYLLAHHIETIFAMEEQAATLGAAARAHAQKTHDPQKNLGRLLEIYQEIR